MLNTKGGCSVRLLSAEKHKDGITRHLQARHGAAALLPYRLQSPFSLRACGNEACHNICIFYLFGDSEGLLRGSDKTIASRHSGHACCLQRKCAVVRVSRSLCGVFPQSSQAESTRAMLTEQKLFSVDLQAENVVKCSSLCHGSVCTQQHMHGCVELLDCDSRLGRTFMVSRAVDLSPIVRIWLGWGPMKWIPWSLQMSTKPAFSDRKP